MRCIIHAILAIVLLSCAFAQIAQADCANPSLPDATVFYNQDYNVFQYCNGIDWIAMGEINPSAGSGVCANPTAPESSMIYNTDYSVMQFCNGEDWIAIGPYPTGLSGPAGCANIGDLCADGTVFAGYHPLSQEHLFIPTVDQERPGSPGTFTMNWKNATGTDDINSDSTNDGQINHANRGGAIGDFQAFQACEDLSFGGRADWYLPSQIELYYVWTVHDTIEAGGNITSFQNALYWSSSEYSPTSGFSHDLTNGIQDRTTKANASRVRCIRR